MGGFCRRCGDIIRSDSPRCSKCGGTSVSSQVSRSIFEQPNGSAKADPWLRTYGGKRSISPSSIIAQRSRTQSVPSKLSNSAPFPTSPPRAADLSRDPMVTPKSSPSKLRRGLSVRASAQAHVRALTSAMPEDVELSAAEEEVLSNVFGSVLDPNETRGRCGMCKEMFRRDMKIFPDPRREEGGGFEGVFYCRGCYSKEFSRGNCGSCGKVVVGDEQFISLGKGGCRGFWHRSCFRCTHCRADVSSAPAVDLNGKPCCETCFDKPGAGTQSVTNIPDLRTRTQSSPDRIALRPAVEELRKRLRSAGLDSSPSRAAAVPAPAPAPPAPTAPTPAPPVTADPVLAPITPLRVKKANPPSSTTSQSSSHIFPTYMPQSSQSASDIPPSNASLPTHPPQTPPRAISPSANPSCAACHLPLFRSTALGGGSIGSIVTLPTSSDSFHASCLRCDGCSAEFVDGKYVEEGGKRNCIKCTEKLEKEAWENRKIQKPSWTPNINKGGLAGPPASMVRQSFPTPSNPTSPPTRPPLSPRIAASPFLAGANLSPRGSGSPRLGGQPLCGGCGKSGTLSETKQGPGGERWHVGCLKCFGCRKGLDSGAKLSQAGKVGCRDCLDKEKSAKRGPTYSPLLAFGGSGRLASLA